MPSVLDATIWRTHPYTFFGYLWLDKPPVVFACRVNGTITFPVDTIPYNSVTTGAYTDCWPHQEVLFGSTLGADDLGRGRLRKAPDSSNIYIGRSSQGTQDGTCNIVNGSYITVIDSFPPAARIPYIADGNTTVGGTTPPVGTQFRDFDLAYTVGVNGSPQVNLGYGPGFAGNVDPNTNTLTVDFTHTTAYSKSYDSNIASYSVNIGDGTIVSGTSPNIKISFPVGRRHVHFTATDGNGNSTTRHILVVACKDGGAYEAIKYFSVADSKLGLNGNQNTFDVRVYQNIPLSTYPDKMMVIYFEEEWYSGTLGSMNVIGQFGQTGCETVKFCGWHFQTENTTDAQPTGTISDVTLKCLDICGWLDQLPGFSIEVNRKASPTSWIQMQNANMDKYFAEGILYYFSTARFITDFYDTNTGDMYGLSRLGSGENTLYKQIQELADRAIGYELTCNEQGMIYCRPNQNLLISGNRTSVNIVSINEDDIKSIRHVDQRHPKTHWNRGAAVLTSTVDIDQITTPQTAFAVAPGKAPGQGSTATDRNEQLCIAATELFIRTAARDAEDNSDIGDVEFELVHTGDAGIEPAYGQWVPISVPAQYTTQRGLQFTSTRLRVLSAQRSCQATPTGNTKTIKYTGRAETVGVSAVDDTPPSSNITPAPPVAPSPPPIITNSYNAKHDGTSVIAHDAAHIALGNYYTTGARWRLAPMSGLSGTLQQLKLDPFAPFLITKTGSLPAYMLTTTGLFYITDILNASSTWSHQQTWSVYSPALDTVKNSIRPSSTSTGHIYAAFWDGSTIQTYHLSSNGSVVVAHVPVGFSAGDGAGMDIDNYGADEMILGIRNGSTTFAMYQILNGGAPTRLTADISQTLCYFVQKPLLTFSGSPNSSTSSSECFIWISASDAHLLKTSNGGSTYTNITPPGSGGCLLILSSVSSMAFTTNSTIMVVVGTNNKIYTTQDSGTTWRVGATLSGTLINTTIGYYPSSVGGSYALYGGGSGLAYSPDFGNTIVNATGDWLTSIGAISGEFLSVIPLY